MFCNMQSELFSFRASNLLLIRESMQQEAVKNFEQKFGNQIERGITLIMKAIKTRTRTIKHENKM